MMINKKRYIVLGIMSGTSMDGLDCSVIETDGHDYNNILLEQTFNYSFKYIKELKKIIKYLPETKNKQLIYSKKKEIIVNNELIKIIKNFLKISENNKININLIGFSGQTIYHNPVEKYSLQLGSGKLIHKKTKIPTVSNFRENDLKNNGQGAPIGSFYHEHILKKIKGYNAIINIGGVSNITYIYKKKLLSYDICQGNALIDDLCYHFFKKNYDLNGCIAKKGEIIKEILNKYKKNDFFLKKYPKSLDRNYFNAYLKILKKQDPYNAVKTASMMTVIGIIENIKLINLNFDSIVLTGGGRNNLFIFNKIKERIKNLNIKVSKIDSYGLDGDMIESQMFGYIAVRSIKKLPLSLPTTTGVLKPTSGGRLFGKLKN